MIEPILNLNLTLDTLPPIMTRGEHVLILLVDEHHNLVLGDKKLYPPGIVRMVGGGTDGEDPLTAAQRELAEEVGLELTPDQLIPLGTVVAHITSQKPSRQLTFTTYLFASHVTNHELVAADDLDGLKTLSIEEFNQLIQNFQALSPEIETLDNPKLSFSWADYGKLYGQVHQWALERYQQIQPAT